MKEKKERNEGKMGKSNSDRKEGREEGDCNEHVAEGRRKKEKE